MLEAQPMEDRKSIDQWRFAIIAGFAVGGITVSAWGPRLPAIIKELDVGTGTIGLLMACATIGSLIGLVSAGPLLHRLGSRRSIAATLYVVAAGIALLGVSVMLGLMSVVAVAFALTGAGVGSMDIMINVEGAAIEAATGRTQMPLMHGAWSVGAAIGSGIGAACAAAGISPSLQFIGEAFLIAFVALAAAPAIPDGRREEERDSTTSRTGLLLQWFKAWMNWRLILIGVILLGVELGEGSANNWLTLAAESGHGQTPAVAAVFFTVFACVEAATRIFGGPLVDRIGRVAAIRITTFLGIAGLALFISGTSVWLTIGGTVLWAVGVSMGFPLGMSAAAEGGKNTAARLSVVASIGYSASIAGPPIIGVLAESFGLLGAFWLIVMLLTAAFCAARSVAPSARKAQK